MNVGQFRRNQINSYGQNINVSLSTQETNSSSESISGSDLIFENICINLEENNSLQNGSHYYLKFGVQKMDTEQRFYLKIRNTNVDADNEQFIKEYIVAAGTGWMYFETIISPNNIYNQILWELQRTVLDYTIMQDNVSGRIITIDNENIVLSRLVDVVSSYLRSAYNANNLTYLKKIGVQGPPSLLMCINGEEIRIGKSGIYQLYNESIRITSINFVPNDAYFIMDFEY